MKVSGIAARLALVGLLLLLGPTEVQTTSGDVAGQPARQRPAQSVATLAELRTRTFPEQQRAKYFDRDGPPLSEVKIVEIPLDPEMPPAPFPGQSAAEALTATRRERVCDSEAVFIGLVNSTKAFFNHSETFLFTDHQVLVQEWIRPAQGKSDVLVSVMGGRVRVGATIFDASMGAGLELGRAYVFFLVPIPKGEAYTPLGAPLPAAGGRVLAGPALTGNNQRLTDLKEFTKDLATIAAGCKGRR